MTLLGHCQDPERDGAFDQDPAVAIEQGLPESVSAAHFAEKILHLTLQTPSALSVVSMASGPLHNTN